MLQRDCKMSMYIIAISTGDDTRGRKTRDRVAIWTSARYTLNCSTLFHNTNASREQQLLFFSLTSCPAYDVFLLPSLRKDTNASDALWRNRIVGASCFQGRDTSSTRLLLRKKRHTYSGEKPVAATPFPWVFRVMFWTRNIHEDRACKKHEIKSEGRRGLRIRSVVRVVITILIPKEDEELIPHAFILFPHLHHHHYIHG